MAAKQVAANCTIGSGSIFHGKLQVAGTIRIEGKFQGEIHTEADVVIGPSGQAKTDIITSRVVVAGTFIGNISATDEVYVAQTGKVLGSITTPKLTLEPGVVTTGNVTITQDQSEDVGSAVRSAYGADAEEAFTGTRDKPLPLKGKP